MALSDYFPELKGWVPAKENPVAEQRPQIPTPEAQVSPYLRCILPLPMQYSGDMIKQYNRPGLSSFRTPVLPPSGQAAVTAAVQSTATKVAQQVVASNPVVSQITLNVPSIFTPVSQTVALPGPLAFLLAPEPGNTFLGGPATGPGVGGLLDVINVAQAHSTAVSISAQPNTTNDIALLFTAQDQAATATFNPGSP